MTVGGAAFIGIEAGGFAGDFRSLPREVVPRAGDDVYHTKERVVAIEAGTQPTDDLDALDQVHVENEFSADKGAIGKAVIDAMAVDQHQNARIEISAVKAAHAQEGIIAVV